MKCNGDCLNCIYPDCIAEPENDSSKQKRNTVEVMHKYYLAHKAERLAYGKRYREENREFIRKQNKLHQSTEEYKAKRKEYDHKRYLERKLK